MKTWYLAKTKPKKEIIAMKNLENQDFFVFCPIVKLDNKKVILFPGYIFIHIDLYREDWSSVRSTKGLVDFVKFGLNFAKVPDNVINFLLANQDNIANKMIQMNKFQYGDKVQISDGVFKNWGAIFKCYKPNDRIVIMLNLLGKQHSLSLKKDSILAI